jgi:hypothetical protein
MKSDPTELGGRKVSAVVRTDGLKLILEDGSWVCYRLSGHRAGGAGLYGSAQRTRHGSAEGGGGEVCAFVKAVISG